MSKRRGLKAGVSGLTGILSQGPEDLPVPLRWAVSWGRIFAGAFRRFVQDACILWSSALTFYTLMSVVPVAALVFSIAKGLGYRRVLLERLSVYLSGQEEVLAYISAFADRLISQTSGGVLAGVGSLVLLWSVIMMLGTIENTFNTIWRVSKPRTWMRRFTDYLSVMLVGPLLFLSASSVAIVVITHLGTLSDDLGIRGVMGPVFDVCLRSVPALLMWALLTFLYVFIPNHRVRMRPALISGAISGIAFILLQRIYIGLQIGVTQYNAVYGSFAALPLFLTFVQAAWILVLYGAEVCHAIQYKTPGMNVYDPSPFEENLAALVMTKNIINGFLKGDGPVGMADLWRMSGLNVESLRKVTARLEHAGIIRQVAIRPGDVPGYIPNRDPSSITASDVVLAAAGLAEPAKKPRIANDTTDLVQILESLAQACRACSANGPLVRTEPPPGTQC